MKRNLGCRFVLTWLLAGLLVFVLSPSTTQTDHPVNAAQPALTTQDIPGLLARAGIPLENLRPQLGRATPSGPSATGESSLIIPAAALSDLTYHWHTFYGGAVGGYNCDVGFYISPDIAVPRGTARTVRRRCMPTAARIGQVTSSFSNWTSAAPTNGTPSMVQHQMNGETESRLITAEYISSELAVVRGTAHPTRRRCMLIVVEMMIWLY